MWSLETFFAFSRMLNDFLGNFLGSMGLASHKVVGLGFNEVVYKSLLKVLKVLQTLRV